MENIKKEILTFFNDLSFEETEHKYHVNGNLIKLSVSGVIKKFVKYVDFSKKATEKDLRLNLPIGTTAKQWENNKQRACKLGSNVHLFGELYPFNKHLEPRNEYEKAIVKFWNDLPSNIVPVVMELQMYHKEYMFAGTADILLYNKDTDSFIIGDYKTNKDLFKNFKGKTLLYPFNDMLDSPYSKYELQLSFYQILFKQLGFKVSSRKLIWLKPSSEYVIYNTEDYTKKLKDYLNKNEL